MPASPWGAHKTLLIHTNRQVDPWLEDHPYVVRAKVACGIISHGVDLIPAGIQFAGIEQERIWRSSIFGKEHHLLISGIPPLESDLSHPYVICCVDT